MKKQLPNVFEDMGFRKEAQDFAKGMMSNNGVYLSPCKDLNQLSKWLENALAQAFLHGANRSVRLGYILADKDWEAAVRYYQARLKELENELNKEEE